MLDRHLTIPILNSLKDSPVVFIQGARQTGKTTLARSLGARGHAARYLTLDDATVLAAAEGDPHGFVSNLEGAVIIDEIQRVPALAMAIKAAVDADRKPGRFLLTGSASVLVLPQLAESLVGRLEIHTLWPLSRGEITGQPERFIDAAFGTKLPALKTSGETRAALAEYIVRGGYPEMLHRTSPDRRQAWFGSYITTILQRDVRDITNVRDLADMPRLLALIAARSAGLLDYTDLARTVAISPTTLRRYLALLEATFLVQLLPAWFTNFSKRIAKAPKLLMTDTGLLAYQLGIDVPHLLDNPALSGHLIETFVAMELLKQRGWSRTRPGVFHFRTHAGDEVDFVLEDSAGRIVGIEVKAASSVSAEHFKGLKVLAEAAGERFVRGIILYTGTEAVPFGKDLFAVPIAALWQDSGTETHLLADAGNEK